MFHASSSEMRARSSEPTAAPHRDALSQVLRDLRIAGASYGRCELTRPWGIDFPPQEAARFHFVAAGECRLHVQALGWTTLEEGEVALLPRGIGHSLADAPRSRRKPLGAFPLEEIGKDTYRLRAGGDGEPTLLVCCSVEFEEPALHPLLDLMPPVLRVRAGARDPALGPLLDAMSAEVMGQRVGAATVMTRLADAVITRMIRAWVEARNEDAAGWLAAIRDPTIGRVLAAIHENPGGPWTLDSLSQIARTSRSTFADRFKAVMGVAPAQYLLRWRMHVASLWMRRDRLTVAEAAARLGYDSNAAFSRAFKRLRGIPPSTMRRERPGGNV
jgi:AraC-like DNA-binding protein